MRALRETDPRRIGPYDVVGRLGVGGMGEVFLAHAGGGMRVAVKVVRAEHGEDPLFRARFRHEVRAAQSVGATGAYIARVVDADTEAEQPWMATEFVEGPNLRDAVRGGGPLSAEAVRALAAALGEALVAIHAKGMVHRDLKPSNILLAPDGPRVIDFGIVRALEATSLTRTGSIVGSAGYVSPEQISNGAEVGPPSDVFSLGAVLGYAATGRELFGEGTDAVILMRVLSRDFDVSDVPDGVRGLVKACLAEDPAKRPTPAGVIAEAGHTRRSLRQSLTSGWYGGACHFGAGGWAAEHDADLRASGVEYVAQVTGAGEPGAEGEAPAEGEPSEPAAPSSARQERRGFLRALTGGVLVLAGGGVGGWAWLRDQERGGVRTPKGSTQPSSRSSTTPSAGAVPGAWHYSVGGLGYDVGPCVALSPDRKRVYVGGEDGSLHAVSPEDGSPVWTTPLGLPVMSPLSTADGVYCLLDGHDGPAKLCALGHDGAVRWSKEVDGGYANFLVAAGELILLATGPGAPDTGGVQAYTSDGGLRWNARTQAAPTSDPVAAKGVAYVGTYGDVLQALNLKDGSVLWSVAAGTDVGRPTVVGDMLVVGSSGEVGLYGILRSGRLSWSTDNPDVNSGTSFTGVRFGDLLVSSAAGTLTAIDPSDGSTVWKVEGDGYESGESASAPAVVGETVYVRMGARLHAVDRRGRKKWSESVPGVLEDSVISPVVDGTHVYTATADGIAANSVPA
ncbi:serine/threonine-protein kinase [Streptomyces sp. NPDC047081]|uniref:serine/threonine-protein kinase n=1 Tax=Streptomyces sp. NPDC047081 TaxID=3154706 RepID=UPI0033DB31F7